MGLSLPYISTLQHIQDHLRDDDDDDDDCHLLLASFGSWPLVTCLLRTSQEMIFFSFSFETSFQTPDHN